MLLAHYFATKTTKFLLITDTNKGGISDPLMKIYVTGNADARKQAAVWNAKPWNF